MRVDCQKIQPHVSCSVDQCSGSESRAQASRVYLEPVLSYDNHYPAVLDECFVVNLLLGYQHMSVPPGFGE